MASRLTFGIDPGISGAIAVLADGEAGPIIDMPLLGEDREVDARQVALFIRAARALHPDASVSAVIERVRAMPPKDGARRAGAQSSFNFGDHYGKAKAVLELLGIPYTRAEPASWKRQFGLTGQPKDASRVLAIQRFPTVAAELKRKKDNGRADALLIALYGEQRLASGVAA